MPDNLKFVGTVVKPEPECEQWVRFQVAIKTYGRRSRQQHALALRLCRMLFQLFSQFEVKLLEPAGGGRITKDVIYNPDGEGGTVTFE